MRFHWNKFGPTCFSVFSTFYLQYLLFKLKMGRTIICEEHLIDDLESVQDANNFVPGLILGQFAGQRDYVFHLPKTRFVPPENEMSVEVLGKFSKVSDIDESAVSEHARTVIRMLPGGMWILGFYIISPSDVFADKNSITKLKTISQAIYNCTRSNEYLHGRDPSNQMLIFNFCSLSRKYSCKSLDMNSLNSSFRPADWKFKNRITNWLYVDSKFNLSWMPTAMLSNNNLSTKKKCFELLAQFQAHLDNLQFCINGDFCPLDKSLINIEPWKDTDQTKENKKEGRKNTYKLMFYEFKEPTYIRGERLEKKSAVAVENIFTLCGILSSRVFLNEKSTAEDALKAVKEDMLRSLASRFEMHWQTFEEPEDCNSYFLLRYPPRRVMFTPENSDISFYEYIFEGETEKDALATLCENLDFEDGNIESLEKFWEPPIPRKGSVSAVNKSTTQSKKPTKKKVTFAVALAEPRNPLVLGIAAAGICLCLSLIAHFLLST